MAATINYDRPKIATINDTPIDITIQGRESPDAFGNLGAGTGTTGVADVKFRADADESGGADVQDLWDIALTPSIHEVTGVIKMTIVATPVLGDASNGTPVTTVLTHDETSDAWQSAAGRARQA